MNNTSVNCEMMDPINCGLHRECETNDWFFKEQYEVSEGFFREKQIISLFQELADKMDKWGAE